MALTPKQTIFVLEYLNCWNASEAARRAGYSPKTAGSQGDRLLKDAEVAAEIEREIAERQIKPAEVLSLLTEHARSRLGDFFKVSDRWTTHPLAEDEIIDERDVIDAQGNTKHEWFVRRTVIDRAKLTDPKASRLVRKFSETKNGVSIELHDAQAALEKLGKALGVLTDRMAVTTQEVIAELPKVDDELETVAGSTNAVSPQ